MSEKFHSVLNSFFKSISFKVYKYIIFSLHWYFHEFFFSYFKNGTVAKIKLSLYALINALCIYTIFEENICTCISIQFKHTCTLWPLMIYMCTYKHTDTGNIRHSPVTMCFDTVLKNTHEYICALFLYDVKDTKLLFLHKAKF